MSNFFLKKLYLKSYFMINFNIFNSTYCHTNICDFLFYERHWEKIINRFANIAANEITFIVNELEKIE